MKKINNLYDKINDIDIIIDMYDNVVSKNTKNKQKIEKFNDYYSINIINIKNIIEAANITKADSIHPGFGFLSENSQFSKMRECWGLMV